MTRKCAFETAVVGLSERLCAVLLNMRPHFCFCINTGQRYHKNTVPTHCHSFTLWSILPCTEAANVTELTKKAFPYVSHPTMARALHQYRLVSRVCRSKPWISPANVAKHKAWAAAHAKWTVDD